MSSVFYYERWKDCEKEKRDYEEDLAKLNQLSAIASDTQSIMAGVTGSLNGEVASTLLQNWGGTSASAHQGKIVNLSAQSSSINSDLSNLKNQIEVKKRECVNKINSLEEEIRKWQNLYYEALEAEREEKTMLQ